MLISELFLRVTSLKLKTQVTSGKCLKLDTLHRIPFVQITSFLFIISLRCLLELSVEACLLASHFFVDFPDITLQLFYFVFYFKRKLQYEVKKSIFR